MRGDIKPLVGTTKCKRSAKDMLGCWQCICACGYRDFAGLHGPMGLLGKRSIHQGCRHCTRRRGTSWC
eukprot:1683595-Pyramimonas_sp.AAC.2